MISVFSVLNLASETVHQCSSDSCTLSSLSNLLRNNVVSSANMAILGFHGAVGMLMPLISGSFLILQARGSIAKSNRGQESGSPWCTPCLTWKEELSTPLMATCVVACWYSDLIVDINGCERWKASSVFYR